MKKPLAVKHGINASLSRSTRRNATGKPRALPLAASGILRAVALMTLVSCGAPERDRSSGEGHPGSAQQAIQVNLPVGGTQISPGVPLDVVIHLPETGVYNVTYTLVKSVAGPVSITLSSAVPADGGTINFPVAPSIALTDTVYPSHNVTLSMGAMGADVTLHIAVDQPVTIYEMNVSPARTSTTADPTSFFPSATICGDCHQDQYTQWRSSIMSYSSISPPIHALELTENHVGPADLDRTVGAYGRLARTPNAPLTGPHEETGTQLFCQRCHSPIAQFTDVFRVFKDQTENLYNSSNRGDIPDAHTLMRQVLDGTINPDLLRDDLANPGQKVLDTLPDPGKFMTDVMTATEGVSCSVCHRINGRNNSKTGSRIDFDEGVANAGYLVVHNGSDSGALQETAFGPYDTYDSSLSPSLTPAHPATQMGEHTNIPTDPTDGMDVGTDGVHRPFIRTGALCGTCHDVRIAASDNITGENFRRVENLFTEWRDSPWNNKNIPYVAGSTKGVFENPGLVQVATGAKVSTSCQDCHMSRYPNHANALPREYDSGAIAGGFPIRARISNHRFIGVDRFLTYANPGSDDLSKYDISRGRMPPADPADPDPYPDPRGDFDLDASNDTRDLREILLQKAADFKIEHIGPVVNNQFPVSISVENVGVGHNLPAGLSQERQVWIELEVQAKDGRNVFTSGYLNDPAHQFNATDPTRYGGSYCGSGGGANEPHCDLDRFRAELGPYLNILNNSLANGPDLQLRNYENGFSLNGIQNKVFTQFIGDHVDNTKSLPPFQKKTEQYTIPVGQLDPGMRSGPFTVNARLRFRPFPLEFLETLKNAFPNGRVTDSVIEANKVIKMEEDHCVAGTYGLIGTRPCNRDAVVPLSLGDASTCAVFGAGQGNLSGSLQCFGTNSNGEVGIGVGPTTVSSPSVLTLLDVTMTSLGVSHGCALLRDGTVSCWGDGTGGKLADNNTAAHKRTAPRQIAATLNDVTAIASGGFTTCALSRGNQPADATVSCWGQSTSGELGDNNVTAHNRGVPNQISQSALVGVEAIAGGLHHYCAIAQNSMAVPGSVRCWGQAKGTGQASNIAVPTDVGGLAYRAKKLAAGENFTCALLASGEVNCWGDNTFGTLGNSAVGSQSLTPVKVNLDERATDVVAGRNHACALLSQTNSVVCWGRGFGGRLGNGDTADVNHSDPIHVVVPGGLPGSAPFNGVAFIAAGGDHTCAITDTGTRYCWGRNNLGQLGLGHTTDEPTPQSITFADPTVTGRTYYAPASEGGSGTSGPFTTGCTTTNCTDQTTYIDLNEGSGYRFMIQSDGGTTNLFPKIGILSGTRTMGFYVDGAFVQNITSNPTLTPRPQGAELSAITRNFSAGYHSVEFRDIDASSQNQEFDILDLRVAGLAGPSCFDAIQDQNETGVDCGGGGCGACGVGVTCNANSDCVSGVCDATSLCAAPPATPPSTSPCASFCTNPQVIQVNGDYQSHDLGTGAICRETTSLVAGGNCGNFANGRTLTVNGVQEVCNNQNWSSLPAKINGGYCVQAPAGLQSYAYFVLFE